MSIPFLSIILPAHNEERRLEHCLRTLYNWLYAREWGGTEVIVVANGCTDATADICRLSLGYYKTLKYHYLPERGKGRAVRHGMLAASGIWRLMMDVDLSTSLDAIPEALQFANLNGHDIVIGSRTLDQERVIQAPHRRLIGLAFHQLVTELAPGLSDTQCGFKLFWDQAAEDLFRRQKVTGMAFDVELLYLARLRGWSVAEIPVTWRHDPDSRVRLVGDSLSMFWDVLQIPMMHARDDQKAPA